MRNTRGRSILGKRNDESKDTGDLCTPEDKGIMRMVTNGGSGGRYSSHSTNMVRPYAV